MPTPSTPSALSVVIGVNGIGMGHSVRESEIARHLRSRGHHVRIITTSPQRAQHFTEQGLTVLDAWMPKFVEHGNRIRARDIVRNNTGYVFRGLKRHRELRRQLQQTGVPDLFITDYEPNTSRLAYHFGKPLISVDQQSKYRYLDLPPIPPYSQRPDRQRLKLFMPRVEHAFICSFVPLEPPAPWMEFLPPVLPDAVRDAHVTTEPLAVAYYSHYFDHGPEASVRALAETFRDDMADRTLRIYAQPADMPQLRAYGSKNVEILPFDRDAFLADLAKAEAVFSNAGFNLISEAIALGKPLHLVPLPTYDQHWCAQAIAGAGLGTNAAHVERESVLDFMSRAAEISAAVRQHRKNYLVDDPRERIAQYVEQRCAVDHPDPKLPSPQSQ